MYKYEKTSYLIKDIPVETWKRFRSRCMEDGNKVNDVMINLIDRLVKETTTKKFKKLSSMIESIGYRGED